MKAFILFLLLFVTGITAWCQECKGFYYLNNGEVQMTMYDKKANETGKLTYTISGVTNAGGTTTASFTSEMVNEKGKSLSKGAGNYKCTGSVMYIDARIGIPQEQMTAFKDMEVKAGEVYIEYPSAMSAGQTLKDASFKMDIYSKNGLFASVTYDQVNRKVEGKETITTPAGTWECWKISYEAKVESRMQPLNLGIPINMKGTEWFAPGFGIVKTETLTKSGRYMGSTQITSVKK